MSPRTDRTHAAWLAALDELEAVAGRDPQLAADGAGVSGAWAPPAGLGPMPAELADRAAAVAGAQRGALARLDAARKAVLAHLGAVRSVESSHEPERPVYLDATG
ncbi:hypothetical protein ES689_07995 [Frigoribacterium sp. ACAM 257]|uniref:hypothetical protein n=1 Tax=Frigoribacterium sp. ACAM 257 TaxID=2508998 RepID=UPI0011B968DF|nr:hypothetical protein [Frigoribacterium sp. ACAM 257]TWX38561.1 hypothetical protein ES689_07995 [Frigoribacterium sp. ACAM 257]